MKVRRPVSDTRTPKPENEASMTSYSPPCFGFSAFNVRSVNFRFAIDAPRSGNMLATESVQLGVAR
jgi:hypothetical protein